VKGGGLDGGGKRRVRGGGGYNERRGRHTAPPPLFRVMDKGVGSVWMGRSHSRAQVGGREAECVGSSVDENGRRLLERCEGAGGSRHDRWMRGDWKVAATLAKLKVGC
jgi:hypothetical protein